MFKNKYVLVGGLLFLFSMVVQAESGVSLSELDNNPFASNGEQVAVSFSSTKIHARHR